MNITPLCIAERARLSYIVFIHDLFPSASRLTRALTYLWIKWRAAVPGGE